MLYYYTTTIYSTPGCRTVRVLLISLYSFLSQCFPLLFSFFTGESFLFLTLSILMSLASFMPYSTRVRPARPDDLDHIVRLFREQLSKHVPGEYPDLSEYGSALINDVVRRHAFPSDPSPDGAVQSYVIEEINSENILGIYLYSFIPFLS